MKLILNNKANLTLEEAKKYEKQIRKYDIIVLPTTCYLSLFQKGKYILGSQDISEFKENNRTGEINGYQLESLNVKYCLIGHSERRVYKEEKEKIIINKIRRCSENNIIPLYCIGDINDGKKEEKIKEQIDLLMNNYKKEDVYIVYEPLNNIGNPNPTLDTLENTVLFIKEYIKEQYNKNINLIYGGGVNQENIKSLIEIKEIDGLIISTESLKINKLKVLYEETRK